MKILIATEIIPPTIGGPATYLSHIIPSLQKHGHEVVVVSFGSGDKSKLNVELHIVSMTRLLPCRMIAYTRALFKYSKNTDVILSLGVVVAGLPAVLISKLKSIPVVTRIPGDFAWERSSTEGRIHNMSVEDFYSRKVGLVSEIYKKLQRFVINKSTIVFATSKYQARTPKSLWRVDRDINTIYSSLSFRDSNIESNLDFQDKKILLSVGRLIPLKGYKILISILKQWLLDHTDWIFVIVGDGPDRDEIVSFIEENKLQDNIRLVRSVEHEVLYSYYKEADIFLQYSEYEGLANSMLEAIYFNLPVIGTRRGGTTEVLEQYPNGGIVEFGDKEEFLKILNSIVDSGSDIDWPEDVKQQFFRKFSHDIMIDKLEKLLTNSIKQ